MKETIQIISIDACIPFLLPFEGFLFFVELGKNLVELGSEYMR